MVDVTKDSFWETIMKLKINVHPDAEIVRHPDGNTSVVSVWKIVRTGQVFARTKGGGDCRVTEEFLGQNPGLVRR